MASSNGNGANYADGLPPLPVGVHKTRQVVSSSYHPIASMPSQTAAPSKHQQEQRSYSSNNNNISQNYLQQQFLYNQQRQQQQQNIVPRDASTSLEQEQHYHHHHQHQHHHLHHQQQHQYQDQNPSRHSHQPQYNHTDNLGIGQQNHHHHSSGVHSSSATTHRYIQSPRENLHDNSASSRRPANCNHFNSLQTSNRSQQANGREMMSEQQQSRQRQTVRQHQHQQQHNSATSSPSMTSTSGSPLQSRCQASDCPCNESQDSTSNHNVYQRQHHDEDEDDGDDDETNYDPKYADRLRRGQQRIGLHLHQHHSTAPFMHSQQQQQQQQQQQHQQQQQFGANNEARPDDLHQKMKLGRGTGHTSSSRDEARAPLHVNFGTRSSQNGAAGSGAGPNTNGTYAELDDEGEGETTRKKKYLTAKYGQQQMSLIKKRLKIEMWLHEQLQELAKQSKSIGPEELDEIDIDLDQLLDLEDDATRQHSLRKTLAPLSDLPAADINKFINDVLEQSKLL